MSARKLESLQFRPMQNGDIARIIEIENEAHKAPWTQGIFEDCIRVGYCCPLLVLEDEIVAYGIMSVVAGEAHIYNICVALKEQCKGYGRSIMEHLLDIARQKNAASIFLEVRPTNTHAINLYESLGFQEVGVRKNYYPAANGCREDANIMAIELVS